ncbi:MAG: tRNA lysidine(34) synthetase TilS [Holosporales bacterium]
MKPRSSAVSNAEFIEQLDACGLLPLPPRLAVAVSGGADSMALALLIAAQPETHVTALIIDHGLREAAAIEAVQTQNWLKARGITAVILKAELEQTGNVLARARMGRYAALKKYCASHTIPALLIGQHQDDQAETVWLALKRGSGTSGLAGIPAVKRDGALTLYRPLLAFPKARLEATCREAGQAWLSDPSNYTDRDRGAYRQLPERLRLLPHRLAGTATAAAAAESLITNHVDTAEKQLLNGNTLNRDGFLALPIELQRRLLLRLIQNYTGTHVPSRARGVAELLRRLRAGALVESHGLRLETFGSRITLVKTASAA